MDRNKDNRIGKDNRRGVGLIGICIANRDKKGKG